MTGLIDRLTSNRALVISFVLMLLCGMGFLPFIDSVGGRLLDETWNQADAQALLAGMSSAQQNTHFWVTVLLDSAYPLFYGAFFVGAIARLAGKQRRWAVWPSLIGVDCDFAENIVQAMALSGSTDLLFLKDFLTPIKFGGLAIGVLLIVVFGIVALVRRNKTHNQA